MIRKNVAEIIDQHLTLQIESIDRMYLNGYIPRLQSGAGAAFFIREQFDCPMASTRMVEPMTRQFVEKIERFAESEQVELIRFEKGVRKDDIAKACLAQFEAEEGVLFIGKAQEMASVFRTERRHSAEGASYPWLYRSTAMVNQYYFYLYDRDFGPLFIKFCSYFPYTVKLCLNGHEWLKRQLKRRGIGFEPLDNGILSCDEPTRVQKIADTLDASKIEAVFRKWLRRLPHPFSAKHRAEDYRYQLSILQAEFALTQVLDRPLSGRQFFEEVSRENIDLGRPDKVQLIFERRVTRRTPGQFRTRVLTEGVVPTLHVDDKRSKIKQYHKEGQALRTETTINNTYDFQVGRLLKNLGELRQIGFQANRRLLRVQTLSHDCLIGEQRFQQLTQPIQVDEQRASALRFGDRRVLALMHALCQFSLSPEGLRHATLRPAVAQLLGLETDQYQQGQMTYDLRRLRLHGLIERVPRSHRYQLTQLGTMASQFYTRIYARALRPAFSCATNNIVAAPKTPALAKLDHAIAELLQAVQLAA